MEPSGNLERLKKTERELASALAELEHEARRVGDRLERGGGRSFTLQEQLRQIQENIATTRADIERIRNR
jgi:predicted  nucleic acid-binding Zn-ribbon protein